MLIELSGFDQNRHTAETCIAMNKYPPAEAGALEATKVEAKLWWLKSSRYGDRQNADAFVRKISGHEQLDGT